jgi:hypothetical protein
MKVILLLTTAIQVNGIVLGCAVNLLIENAKASGSKETILQVVQ